MTAIALLAAPALHGQQITSDRPGIGSGSAVLPHKTLQLETGFGYANSTANDTYAIGEALVRLGAPGFEVELFLNSYVIMRTELSDETLHGEGFQDLGIGLKIPLLEVWGSRFSLSAQGILQTPSGSAFQTNDEWIPSGILLADLGLTDRFGLAVNAGYQAGPGDLDEVFSLIVTPGVSLGGGFGAYAGWAGFFADGADAANSHFAEGGFTYLPNDNLQLDLNGGWDVDSDDYFLGFGLAIRRK